MFVYLSKKISLPNHTSIHTLSWNPDQGWIACGGSSGLLKVLRLDVLAGNADPSDDEFRKGGSTQSNLSMNQTLEGHSGTVLCSTWNASHRKLATSDGQGLIIVWTLHKGMWYEEMINSRNKSVVRDMKWTSDGKKICIVYEDGAVIVGSVEGNRLWGENLGTSLHSVEWSPNGKQVIFVSSDAVNVFDDTGNFIKKLHHFSLGKRASSERGKNRSRKTGDNESLKSDDAISPKCVSAHWYDGSNGYFDQDAPTLAIAFSNGSVQISCGIEDTQTVEIEAEMALSGCRWNPNGTILALCGTRYSDVENGNRNMVKFYSPFGVQLSVLKVPGSGGLSSITWEGTGLRVALAYDASIYIASIREPQYIWSSTPSTVVFAFSKPNEINNGVTFWNLRSGERRTRYMKNVYSIEGAADHFLLVQKARARNKSSTLNAFDTTSTIKNPRCGKTRCNLTLCDTIGSILDTRSVPIEPLFTTMTECHIVIGGQKDVYVWEYLPPTTVTSSARDNQSDPATSLYPSFRKHVGKERIINVDNQARNPSKPVDGYELFQEQEQEQSDSINGISAIGASEKYLLIAQLFGNIQIYTFPNLVRYKTVDLNCPYKRPVCMHMNCDSTKFSIIDSNFHFSIFELDLNQKELGHKPGEVISLSKCFERKDIWDMTWSKDNSDSFVTMEKTKLFVFHDCDPKSLADDPVQSSGYLLNFEDLEVTTVLLDDVISSADIVPPKDFLLKFESKRLQEARHKVKELGTANALTYFVSLSHPRLWRLLARCSLEALDFRTAHMSFVSCEDIKGISFVQETSLLKDPMRQKAEIASFYGQYDEAEEIYHTIDRVDLAIRMRSKQGNWFRVVQLLQQNGGGDGNDNLLHEAWKHIGDHYADRSQWSKAATYYMQANDLQRALENYYRAENFDALERLIDQINEGSPVLAKLASCFLSVGRHKEAARCHAKLGDIKSAIDTSMILNRWDDAARLATEGGYVGQIENVLAKRSRELSSRREELLAVELYHRANRMVEAAQMLSEVAEDVGKGRVGRKFDPMRSKKLHALAAVEVERYRKSAFDLTGTSSMDGSSSNTEITTSMAATTAATLDTMMSSDADSRGVGLSGRILDSAWRGAAAYHFHMLAHRQMYAGKTEDAMYTAIRCSEYEDVLDPVDIYSLVALTSFYSGHFGVCNGAFIKLETLPNLEKTMIEAFQALALKIFTAYPPKRHQHSLSSCYKLCLEQGVGYQACIVTGRSILNERTVQCATCHHYMIEREVKELKNCPLCHSLITLDSAMITIMEEEDDNE